jgi:DNA-directed RNA polymerase subunit RPC12/RpoP
MIVFPCQVCRTQLSAEEAQAGQLVRCPTCLTTLRVPAEQVATAAAALAGMTSGGTTNSGAYLPPNPGVGGFHGAKPSGKRYGFNCGYCSSRLEATESMAAQEGQCPTCGNNITIPILDRYGRLIDPKTRQIIKQDPHPVHAYAAAGDRAPGILRGKDGKQVIQCPRCNGTSPISANNCKGCGMPFTMEGTTLEAAGTSNGFCVASLVLGIIGLPAACAIIPPVLAVIFGIIGYNQVSRGGESGGGKGMAIAGIICGSVGCLFSLYIISQW